jgi:hypothetical protein
VFRNTEIAASMAAIQYLVHKLQSVAVVVERIMFGLMAELAVPVVVVRLDLVQHSDPAEAQRRDKEMLEQQENGLQE